MKEVVYEEKDVELSREYPFAKDKKITVKEFNGFDEEAIQKQVDQGKMVGYVQIARSTGIEYQEALSLALKDSQKILETISGF